MTGYDEAVAWLKENAPDWRFGHAESRLAAGMTIGAPTLLRCEVTLLWHGSDDRDGPWLSGEGETLLAAVQNAVGGLPAADRMGRAIG